MSVDVENPMRSYHIFYLAGWPPGPGYIENCFTENKYVFFLFVNFNQLHMNFTWILWERMEEYL
jgi:hypothetical protein